MVDSIRQETEFFLICVLSGFIVLLLYDFIRILRRVVKHRDFFVGIEDILFGIIIGIEFFKIILRYNNGIIRVVFMIAYVFGMYIYNRIFSKSVVNYISYILNMIINYMVVKPIKLIYNFIVRRTYKIRCIITNTRLLKKLDKHKEKLEETT